MSSSAIKMEFFSGYFQQGSVVRRNPVLFFFFNIENNGSLLTEKGQMRFDDKNEIQTAFLEGFKQSKTVVSKETDG